MHKCAPCGFECAKASGLERHFKSAKHLRQTTHLCPTCAKPYKTPSGLWKHQQTCNTNSFLDKSKSKSKSKESSIEPSKEQDLAALLLEQQKAQTALLTEIKTQWADMAPRLLNPPPVTTYNTTNNVLVFLNHDCSNAVNWGDFVAGLKLDLDDSEDLHATIVRSMCAGIQELGVHRRPIHCADVKRRKLYLKTGDVWVNDAQVIHQTLTDSHTALHQRCRAWLQAWSTTHPDWYTKEAMIERYRKLAVQVTDGMDQEKCLTELSKQAGI